MRLPPMTRTRNKPLFQPVDVCLNVSAGRSAHGSEPVALCSEHLDELMAPLYPFSQFLGLFVRQDANGWMDRFSEMGQQSCVDWISLGQLARCSGKITRLARVDHRYGQSRAA